MKMILLLCILLSLAMSARWTMADPPAASQPSTGPATGPTTREFSKGKYFLFLPRQYKADGKPWPMILDLHGSSGRGALVDAQSVADFTKDWPDFPFVRLVPVSPGHGWPSDFLETLMQEVPPKLNVDANRFYLTGASMGGMGTWSFAAAHPEHFAAIAPICGRGDPKTAEKLKNLPIWAFHGQLDPIVPIKGSQDMVDALKKLGADVKFTIYPDVAHAAWIPANSNPELYVWFLRHRKEADGNILTSETLTGDERQAEAEVRFHLGEQFRSPDESEKNEVVFMLSALNCFTTGDMVLKDQWELPKDSAWEIVPLMEGRSIKPGKAVMVVPIAKCGEKGHVFPLPNCKIQREHEGVTMTSEQLLPLGLEAYLHSHRPILTAARASAAPAIDGNLDKPLWNRPPDATEFVDMLMTIVPPMKTQAWLAYDDKCLYVAMRCDEPCMDNLKAAVTKRGDHVYNDDDIEFFIDPNGDHKDYYQFVVNALGTIYEAHGQDPNFKAPGANAAAVKGKDFWSVELAIPWADLGAKAPTAESKMAFLMARSRKPKAKEGTVAAPPKQCAVGDVINANEQTFQFPLLNGWNHRTDHYGELKFGR